MANTLLKLVQNILSDMDSDEVNSIYDTVEALQVAQIVMDTLEAEFSNLDLPSFSRIVNLESVADLARPNYLRFPGDVNLLGTLRYRNGRNSGRYQTVEWVTPDEFFERQLMVTSNGANRKQISDPAGFTYWIDSNKAPTFYTSIDNELLMFDSFDALYEDTLKGANSFAMASTNVSDATLTDDYVFPIPPNLYPLLKAEAKATAFLTLKQVANAKSEQIARRQRSRMQNNIYKSGKANDSYARSKFNFARNR